MSDTKDSESVVVGNVRSEKTKKAFIKYLKEHPEERFWLAVRNFSGYGFISAKDIDADGDISGGDTFYWEERDHDSV